MTDTRTRFADEPTVRARAKARRTQAASAIQRWFRQKYSLPTTHPCYLAQSEGEWLEEMYADRYADLDELRTEFDGLEKQGLTGKDLFAAQRRLRASIEQLSEALGETVVNKVADDPVINAIEQDMALGRTDIDLGALLPAGIVLPPS